MEVVNSRVRRSHASGVRAEVRLGRANGLLEVETGRLDKLEQAISVRRTLHVLPKQPREFRYVIQNFGQCIS